MTLKILGKISRFLAPPLDSKLAETSITTSSARAVMSNSSEQNLTSTDGASALQAGRDITVNQGLSYADTRQIALDVFRANFYELAGMAKQEAATRAEEVTEAFLRKLNIENPEAFRQANDPGFQHALYTMQKEHAKTGDKDLGELLVDLLVDRTKHPQRDIIQIVLDESLITAPKLTEGQLANLALVFLFRYTMNHGLANKEILGEYFDKYAKPFADKLSKSQASFQHLEFSGCGSISLTQISLEEIFSRNYQGLFTRGFGPSEIGGREITLGFDQRIFIPCLNDPSKLQVCALNQDVLDGKLAEIGASEEDKARIKSLFDHDKMSAEEIRNMCVEVRSYMGPVFDFWSSSAAMSFTLTSVGIAIGHANIKRLAGEFSDLAIWIN